jgi:methylmalonyl-CoA/ethylmalonyl-CoA epimerase
MTALPGGCDFHHAGVACRDIGGEAARLAPLGYAPEGMPFVDPRQGVRGMFVVGGGPRLELLEPLPDTPGMLAPWLERDVKLYHLAYETGELGAAIEHLRSAGAKLVAGPTPAVAFGGREIAFLMLPNRMLVELIAREER